MAVQTIDPKQRRRIWGDTLRAYLDTKDMTPRELRDELARLGASVAQQSVYDWLRGKTSPTPEHQYAVSVVLGVDHDKLFPIHGGGRAFGLPDVSIIITKDAA